MRLEHLPLLCCPSCHGALDLRDAREDGSGDVETGFLQCIQCSEDYPIIRSIPRFVPIENYASSFGLEWVRHARTQYDSQSGVTFSRSRFFEETGWPEQMEGETILEAGSGSGRFTEQAASTGATVVSFDLSYAVEANHASNGTKPNVLIVQADIFRCPVRPESFDKVYCFGVLQHTPDPRRAFLSLPPLLRPGGEVVVDVYKKTLQRHALQTKYWIRPLTRHQDPETLYRWVRRYVDLMWPVASLVRRIPKIGAPLNWRLLIADYSHRGLPSDQAREWAYLDTFDMLAPRYDLPQTLAAVREWFSEAGLVDLDVHFGPAGVQGKGKRPMIEASISP